KKSAGLIIEDGYRPRQDRFDHVAFLEKMGADPELVTLFFFAYPYGPIAKLARALASYKRPLQILLSATKSGEMLKAELEKLEASHIRLVQLPFVDQESFDEILWASDIAFIRGEDSAARAMLAGTPFVWHIYHQDDDAHMVKLAAMSEKMREVVGDTPLFNTWEQFQAGYNEGDIDGEALHQLLEHLEQWLLWSHWWQNHLHENGPMSQKFAEFLRNR
ncbi:MAG: elongation factor P maturation arginine rhamnosyltransferase EarP, partial [Burkholderiaceae bacterium]|nr:elongation factor P maturation arginine rhamnosyltransferase EarP [Burkholderiaceae bacterium]